MATTKKTTTKKAATKTKKAVASKTTAVARKSRPVTLVTGGTGFLGSHLVRLLVDEGVKPLRVLSTSAPAWLEQLGVETIEGSITSPETVAKAVEGVAEVYHLAGRVSREPDDAHSMYKLHVDGTRVLCEAARAAGVKSIVMASTSGTIAVTEDGDIVPDEDWPTPLDIISRWPYYASKLYQERVALENFDGDGRRLVMLNPSLLLGPGDERLSSTKVVLDFLSRKIPTVPKGGLSFVDARDAAQAFIAAMRAGRHGERYLLGSANWTFDRFFKRLERITKVPAPFVSLPSKLAVAGARGISSLFKQWKLAPPFGTVGILREMVALAAADYFFDNRYKRAYMNNFTNIVPIERSGSLRQSLRHARSFLERGFTALIFPEGTRSMTGQMAEFKSGFAYLALNTRTGILPGYLWGTYEAFPKGSTVLKSREVGARIGRFLSPEELEELTKGMPRAEAYRLVAALVRHEIENLRDGTRHAFDATSLRRRWKAERRHNGHTEEAHDEGELATTGD